MGKVLLVIFSCYSNSKWPDEKKRQCAFTETNHGHIRGKRNTTSQCFLIAIDLLSCSLQRTSLRVWGGVCMIMHVCVARAYSWVYSIICSTTWSPPWSSDSFGTGYLYEGQSRHTVLLYPCVPFCSLWVRMSCTVFFVPSIYLLSCLHLCTPLSIALTLSKWPLLCFFLCHTGDRELYWICGLSMFVNAVPVCVCVCDTCDYEDSM